MKPLVRFSLIFLTVAILTGIQACQKEEVSNESPELFEQYSHELKSKGMNTFYSHSVPVGEGVARAWIKVTKDNTPLEVGIDLSAEALINLPAYPVQYVLPLPKNKGQNFYSHILFDWNPGGHEPPGIYDIAHFDFHFYIESNDFRMAIPGSFDMDTPVAPQYVPGYYIQLPGIVPEMGVHWADVRSPELNPVTPATFTKTFIWGSYAGEFIFWEPMITRDYLLSEPNEIIPIQPQPAAYQRDGYYANSYQISYTDNPPKYTIALVDLEHHYAE